MQYMMDIKWEIVTDLNMDHTQVNIYVAYLFK